jgi:hypothetical protein
VRGAPVGAADSMWLVRLFACGCPWIAIGLDPEWPIPEACEAAGASAYLAHPFTPAKLRELLWHRAIPHVGKSLRPPLGCDGLLRFLAIIRSDVLLQFTTDGGQIGYLAVKGGRPVYASVVGGPDGAVAFTTILSWGKRNVLGQPLPNKLNVNLPEKLEPWLRQVKPTPDVAPRVSRRLPGNSDVCDLVLRDIPDATVCVIAELPTGQVIARPSSSPPLAETETQVAAAMAGLLCASFRTAGSDPPPECAEEVVLLGREEWCVATRLRPTVAIILSGTGLAPLGIVRQVFAAAAELDRLGGLVLENADESP